MLTPIVPYPFMKESWFWLLSLAVAVLLPPSMASAREIPADQLAFFEKRIRPVLVTQCYRCHSVDAPQVKGSLLLDTRDGIERGGDSGRTIVTGKPDESLLIQVLRHGTDVPAMPPGKPLSDEVVADFERWVQWGAPDPRDGKSIVASEGIDIEKGRQFWSFNIPRPPTIPVVHDETWPRSNIDRLILASLEENHLRPVEDADAYTLVRRLFIDLIGITPSPRDVTHWVDEISNRQSVTRLVDSLLASPHFGERWGRHWLDVARYAETSGRQVNFNYPHAWRFRDWVISAFNDDLPYDEFVRMQIAGDLMTWKTDDQRASQMIATGFLAIGPKVHSERNSLQFQMDLIDEQIDVTTQAFLGLTVACARCHGHKFDPIPQRDYYALAGIFQSTEACYGTIRIIQSYQMSPLVNVPTHSSAPLGRAILSQEELSKLIEQLATVRTRFDEQTKAGDSTTGTDFNNIATWSARIADYSEDGLPIRKAMAVRDRSSPVECLLYERGEIEQPGEAIPRGFIQVVARTTPSMPSNASGRLELAHWITARENPLTARVMVNRIWMHLFGRGIVSTPDNFGMAGLPPDHPGLLDHLASSFMDDGWSIKRLIRRIVLSRAYQMGSLHDSRNFAIDPDNAMIWRMASRRLDAESIRDSLLRIAGELDESPCHGSPIADEGENNTNPILRKLAAIDAQHVRRALYLPIVRDSVVESLSLFDFADPSLVVSQRATTTVPAQSLYLLNSRFVEQRMSATAKQLLSEFAQEETRLRQAYLLFYGRPPSDDEMRMGIAFLSRYAAVIGDPSLTEKKLDEVAWTAFCKALVATGDFLYRH